MINYYSILQIQDFSSQAQIKSAFRKLAILYHPDKYNGSSEKFLNIYEAYSFLSNPATKETYDKALNDYLNHNHQTLANNKYKFNYDDVIKNKEIYQSFSREELDIFFKLIKGRIPDLSFSIFFLGLGLFFVVMSFSAPETYVGTILGLAFGIPLTIVGLRDFSLILKIKEFKKTYPIIKDA